MKKIKIFSVILMAMITIFANSMVAFAAPQTMPDGNTFDPEYYAEHNPDVVAVFGTDANALYSHYKTYGIKEGRLPYDGAVTVSPKVGKASNALAQARYNLFYNNNVYMYTNDPAVFFDADYYLANYPDLATTVGTDYKSLFNHYINIGRFEGRSARMGIYPERGKMIGTYLENGKTSPYFPNNYWLQSRNDELKYLDWLSTVINDSMSEREIVTVIHDEICNRVSYGSNGITFEAFENGTGQLVCSGYAGLFKLLCGYAGIETQTLTNITTMSHDWNRVKVDGVWYDVDVTWDDCGWGYKYFLIPAGTGVFAERAIDCIDGVLTRDIWSLLCY